jgi:FkbM family methyltransferase
MKKYLVFLSRLSQIISGFEKYGNPIHVTFKRALSKNGVMTITDRRTGITVRAAVKSSHMFGETWHTRDYDIPSCPLRPGDNVIDIGANQGFFTCYAALKGANVDAYEPFAESFERLRENIAQNGFTSRVKATQAAVSSLTGKARFWCSGYHGGGTNTMIATHMEAIPGSDKKEIEIDTVSINSVLSAIPGSIRLCKMDCEGAEYDIVRHLADPSKIDSFAIEHHPHAYPLRELVDVLLGWKTHQVNFSSERNMIYVVRNDILQQHAASRR